VARLGDKDYETVELLLPLVYGLNGVLGALRVGCGVSTVAPAYRLLEDCFDLRQTPGTRPQEDQIRIRHPPLQGASPVGV
jgi:hypothetical protein